MHGTVVGCPIDEIDTPALLIDLDRLDRNIARMSAELRAAGVAWRPHCKGHKSPAIAHKELAAGAFGITCAKLGEAEIMAAAGVRDILVANQVVGPIKARRLAALCGQADVIVAVDSIENAREIDAAARAAGTRPRVIVEVNIGMHRAGVEPGAPTVAFSQELAAMEGIRYAGLMGYEGHAMGQADPVQRRAEIERTVRILVDTAEACRATGLPVEIVSASGTGTYQHSTAIAGITEVQASGGIFGDAFYRSLDVPVEPALTILVGVTSRPAPNRIIIDAGRKTLDASGIPPTVRDLEGVTLIRFSAEHGNIALDHDACCPRVGDRLVLDVGYHDGVVHLHDRFYGIRNGMVEVVWPIAARGRLQ
ncbi:MAG: DSD1 family PLP-dependent enzyme [Thermomicrobiales bacterium]